MSLLSTSMLIILLHNTTIARSQRTTIDDWSIQFAGYRDRIDSTGSGGSSRCYYEVLHSSSTLIGCSGYLVLVLSSEYAERVWSSLTKPCPCPLHASSSGQEQEEPAASAADGHTLLSHSRMDIAPLEGCLLATIIVGISISRRPVLTNPLLNRFMGLWVLGVDSAGSMTNYHFYGYFCGTKNQFVIFWNPTTWSPVF